MTWPGSQFEENNTFDGLLRGDAGRAYKEIKGERSDPGERGRLWECHKASKWKNQQDSVTMVIQDEGQGKAFLKNYFFEIGQLRECCYC